MDYAPLPHVRLGVFWGLPRVPGDSDQPGLGNTAPNHETTWGEQVEKGQEGQHGATGGECL